MCLYVTLWLLNFGLLYKVCDVTVTLIQNVMNFIWNTSQLTRLVNFIIIDSANVVSWKKLALNQVFHCKILGIIYVCILPLK